MNLDNYTSEPITDYRIQGGGSYAEPTMYECPMCGSDIRFFWIEHVTTERGFGLVRIYCSSCDTDLYLSNALIYYPQQKPDASEMFC